MASTTAVRKIVIEYLAGLIDRKAFTMRFAELLYDFEKCVGMEEYDVVRSIENHLGEAICGLTTEHEFRVARSSSISGFVIETLEVISRDNKEFRVESADSSSPFGAATVSLSVA